jgi:RNA polymerase subunit RPABC4/transcription elongation factor Spt4
MAFKDIVRWLAIVCAVLVLTAYLSGWGLYRSSSDLGNLLPDITILRTNLSNYGPQATSYRELERYAAGSIVRAVLVTNAEGRIMKAYPRPDFFIGQTLPRESLEKAKNQAVYLMSRAGLGAFNYGVRIHEIVNREDKLMGYIFVIYDAQAYYSRSRNWQEAMVATFCLSFAAYWLLVALWVFADALANRKRALLWGAFALLTNLIGLLVYLLVKSITPHACPRCHRTMEEYFSICPYCGPVQNHPCIQCGTPVQSDWSFCPICQEPAHKPLNP